MRPDQRIDRIVAGAHFVIALQPVVARNINPNETAVITAGKFTAGDIFDIDEDVLMIGVHLFTEAVRRYLG